MIKIKIVIYLHVESLNLVKMLKKNINFRHFEVYASFRLKTAGFEHNSLLSSSWSLPKAYSKLNAEAFNTTGNYTDSPHFLRGEPA